MFKKLWASACGLWAFLLAGLAMATPTVTVPSVDQSILTDAGTAIFAAIAVFVAIGLGLRLFKRG